tara:strand:- start:4 stop:147 length:144 start_codon:yes stop_codon:yes gene_type:complete
MQKKINESIKYLYIEYNRLKIKDKKKSITNEEKIALKKLKLFLGKNK